MWKTICTTRSEASWVTPETKKRKHVTDAECQSRRSCLSIVAVYLPLFGAPILASHGAAAACARNRARLVTSIMLFFATSAQGWCLPCYRKTGTGSLSRRTAHTTANVEQTMLLHHLLTYAQAVFRANLFTSIGNMATSGNRW